MSFSWAVFWIFLFKIQMIEHKTYFCSAKLLCFSQLELELGVILKNRCWPKKSSSWGGELVVFATACLPTSTPSSMGKWAYARDAICPSNPLRPLTPQPSMPSHSSKSSQLELSIFRQNPVLHLSYNLRSCILIYISISIQLRQISSPWRFVIARPRPRGSLGCPSLIVSDS